MYERRRGTRFIKACQEPGTRTSAEQPAARDVDTPFSSLCIYISASCQKEVLFHHLCHHWSKACFDVPQAVIKIRYKQKSRLLENHNAASLWPDGKNRPVV